MRSSDAWSTWYSHLEFGVGVRMSGLQSVHKSTDAWRLEKSVRVQMPGVQGA